MLLTLSYFFINKFSHSIDAFFTFVESSSIFVCSAMKRTHMQDLWTSGGQFECEKAGGVRSTGLLTSSMAAAPVRSSHSGCKGNGGMGGPCIRQLPPNRAPSVKLIKKKEKKKKKNEWELKNQVKNFAQCSGSGPINVLIINYDPPHWASFFDAIFRARAPLRKNLIK